MKPLLLLVFFWYPETDSPSLPQDTLLTKKDVSWQVNFRKFDLPVSVRGEIRLTGDYFIFHVNKKQSYNSNYFMASDSLSIDIVIPIDSITKIKKVIGGLIIKTRKQLYMYYTTNIWKEFGNTKFFDDVILMLIKRKSKKKIQGQPLRVGLLYRCVGQTSGAWRAPVENTRVGVSFFLSSIVSRPGNDRLFLFEFSMASSSARDDAGL